MTIIFESSAVELACADYLPYAIYHAYMRSPAWKQLRKLRMIIADGQCEECGCRPQRLEMAHLWYSHYPEEEEAVEQVRMFCVPCHAKQDKRRAKWLPTRVPKLIELAIEVVLKPRQHKAVA